jgi:hypothetical protein
MVGLDILGAEPPPAVVVTAGVVTRGDAIIIGILVVMLGLEVTAIVLDTQRNKLIRRGR